MSHFILVHGAWEESGMWDNVAPILEQNGHTVTAVDLPGHGANRHEGLQVTTELYIDALVDVIGESTLSQIAAATGFVVRRTAIPGFLPRSSTPRRPIPGIPFSSAAARPSRSSINR